MCILQVENVVDYRKGNLCFICMKKKNFMEIVEMIIYYCFSLIFKYIFCRFFQILDFRILSKYCEVNVGSLKRDVLVKIIVFKIK